MKWDKIEFEKEILRKKEIIILMKQFIIMNYNLKKDYNVKIAFHIIFLLINSLFCNREFKTNEEGKLHKN